MLTRSIRSDLRQRQKAALDRIWALRVKASDSYRCWVCGSRAAEAAHLISRRYSSTRWDLANGRALCGTHHRHYTKHPLEWAAYLGGRLGLAAYDALRLRAYAVSHPDYDAIRAELGAA
jgi:HNH endonuclease